MDVEHFQSARIVHRHMDHVFPFTHSPYDTPIRRYKVIPFFRIYIGPDIPG